MLLIVLTLSLWGGPAANAQVESTSTVLLRSSGKPVKSQNLDSSRYKVRQPESRKDEDDEEKPGTVIPSPVTPKAQTKKAAPPPPPPPAPVPVPAPIVPAPIVEPTPAPVVEVPKETPPPVAEQVKELILGGKEQDLDDFKKQIHPEDPRANVIAVSLAPAYYYNGSDSNYSFRRYHSAGPGLGLGMNLWFTPFFGIQSKFFTSVSASQRSGGVNYVPIDIQTFEAGLRFRRHFGYTRKAPQVSLGLDYHDAINKISKESTTAVGRKSNGVSFVLEGEIPTSNTYAHTFQLDVRPRLKHSEMSTGSDARSGTKNETNAIGLTLGGQWMLNRQNQVFWKGQYLLERNLYDGAATVMDPHNDQTPDGVSVTNSLIIFYFGFRWGS